MIFDRASGGQAFGVNGAVCCVCGMTREKFQDNGGPRCTGQRPPEQSASKVTSVREILDDE